MNDMNNLFNEVEAELLKQFKAITPEQLTEEERRRQVQRDWEAQHTAIETEQEEDDEQEGD
jgi:hypothetical protein